MKRFFIFFVIIFSINSLADSYRYNSYNNHGVVGLINMPTARLYDESVFGFTAYDGDPDQKITMSSSPYDWLEASFFYTNIKDKPYCQNAIDDICSQDYIDKGFNFKFRLKEEGFFPAIAIGFNDVAGTGLYSSEYIVASYGLSKVDFHIGAGWGSLNGSKKTYKNPFGYIYDGFNDRPKSNVNNGGEFQPEKYFSGRFSPFGGISYAFNNNLLFKMEYDTTLTPGAINYKITNSNFSWGFDYRINDNFSIGMAHERDSSTTFKFIYKNNPKDNKYKYKFEKGKYKPQDTKYRKLIKNIEKNGIGVNKIVESDNKIGLELTQYVHPSIEIIEDIISFSAKDAGISKNIETDLKTADLTVVSNINDNLKNNGNIVFAKKKKARLNSNTFFNFRPYLASREGFLKGSLLLENNSEYIFNNGLFFSSNIKYSLIDNFDDLNIKPKDTYPAQVRSDIKDYLKSFNRGPIIGRAQFDFHKTLNKNNHLMLSGGILEEMFNGIGIEYLNFDPEKNYAIGFELFKVKKRDHRMLLRMQEFENITGSINFYYRNYDYIPFDAKISYGEYLAGDEGITIDFSRSFLNGTKLGIFATFTDVNKNEFGEGSFDKGIYFNIPIYGSFINYSWRPLTKDPGAKLIRKHTLHDLLVKFKPYNY